MKITLKNLQKKIFLRPKKIKKIAFNTLSLEGIKKSGEITIYFVNDKKIKELNLNYRGENCPTDVITFDITEPRFSDNIFADIVISTDRAIVNAKIYKTTPLYELYLYVVHGILHLLGYDDKNKKDKLAMHKKERQILKTINLSP